MLLALVAQRAQRGRVEREQAAGRRLEPEPARSENAQDVTVREEEHVAAHRCGLGEDPVCSVTHLGRVLAVRNAAGEKRPARDVVADLRRRAALVVAVVPLAEIVARLRLRAETGEPAGVGGPLERAREHELEVPTMQRSTDDLRLAATLIGQWDVGAPRVTERPAPLGLTVPDEDDLFGHSGSLDALAVEKDQSVRTRRPFRRLLAAAAAAGLALAGFVLAGGVAAAPNDTTTSITLTQTTGVTVTTPTTVDAPPPPPPPAPPPPPPPPTTARTTTARTTTQQQSTPASTTTTTSRVHRRKHRRTVVAAPATAGHFPRWAIVGFTLAGVLIVSGLGGFVFTRTRI